METEGIDVMELDGGAIQRLDVETLKDLVIVVTFVKAAISATKWGNRIDYECIDAFGYPCSVSSWNIATKKKVKELLGQTIKLKSNGKKFIILA